MVGFAQAITFVEDSSEMKTNHLRRSNRCLKLEVRALHVSCSVWDTFEYDGCIHGLLTEEMIETMERGIFRCVDLVSTVF